MAEHQDPEPYSALNQATGSISTRHSRNRTGCLTCRRRRKRCDGVRDVCGHCDRLNLVCHWQSRRNLNADLAPGYRANADASPLATASSTPAIYIAPPPVAFLKSDACEDESAQKSLDQRLALRYYVQAFTSILTTNLENNGFLSVLLPMAFEDKTLLDMLVAWSSAHLSLCDDSYRVKALEHRSTALRSFSTSISRSRDSPEASLAGCLVLCSMSAILGDTAGWHNHLVGAAQIISHSTASASPQDGLVRVANTYEGRWLLRNFAYHDILMSVTCDREPLIRGRYWRFETRAAADTYFGLASDPMAWISEISVLNSCLKREAELPLTTGRTGFELALSPVNQDGALLSPAVNGFTTRLHEIKLALRGWTCADSTDPCLVNLAEAYRSAAMLHLYRTMRRWIPDTDPDLDSKIQLHVGAIITHVGQMPLGCLPECTSLFPLFMAGGEAKSKPEMQFIRDRLQHIVTYRCFQNAVSALSVLEELWLQHTSIIGDHALDWLDILKRRDWNLALS
ncbi:fungal-specific transcription factor domain-containing protein [Coniochaeta sp. 2T2.1]|nr:fungal-specific transcription factor domain-containing protein [Coniochaeta sp. 2T2.1]